MSSLGLQYLGICMILVMVKMKHAAALQYRGMLFERNLGYEGIAPYDESFFIENFTNVNRIHCCINCKLVRPSCIGVLYHREQMKCKLLKHYLTPVDKLGNTSHDEWEYLRIATDPDDGADHYDLAQDAECKRTTFGWEYRGKINVTRSGRTCQVWASQSPHAHIVGIDLPENYCRNPDDEPTPWCYTTDPDERFELCDIPMCDTAPLDCITSHDPTGVSYFGTQNVADTGDLCQRWDSQTPHQHTMDALADQGNYCRNPDDQSAPWCYTVNPDKRWSECIIPRC